MRLQPVGFLSRIHFGLTTSCNNRYDRKSITDDECWACNGIEIADDGLELIELICCTSAPAYIGTQAARIRVDGI
jgi:hypothetical protein